MSFLEEARARARRRRSPWNLLLIPAAVLPWLAAWWCSIKALAYVYRLIHPGAPFTILPDGVSGIFMALGPLIGWLPIAMVVGNLLAYKIPSARQALCREAVLVPGADFESSNRALLRAAAVMVPAGLAACLIGLIV